MARAWAENPNTHGAMISHNPRIRLVHSSQTLGAKSAHTSKTTTAMPKTKEFYDAAPRVTYFKSQGEKNNHAPNIRLIQSCQRVLIANLL